MFPLKQSNKNTNKKYISIRFLTKSSPRNVLYNRPTSLKSLYIHKKKHVSKLGGKNVAFLLDKK